MRVADRAWLAIAVGVAVYELAAARRPGWELLSEAADRHRARHPLAVHATAVYLAGHLTRRWPRRIDPLTQITARLRRY
jgi:uncharacterized protein (UPF0548 family)